MCSFTKYWPVLIPRQQVCCNNAIVTPCRVSKWTSPSKLKKENSSCPQVHHPQASPPVASIPMQYFVPVPFNAVHLQEMKINLLTEKPITSHGRQQQLMCKISIISKSAYQSQCFQLPSILLEWT